MFVLYHSLEYWEHSETRWESVSEDISEVLEKAQSGKALHLYDGPLHADRLLITALSVRNPVVHITQSGSLIEDLHRHKDKRIMTNI